MDLKSIKKLDCSGWSLSILTLSWWPHSLDHASVVQVLLLIGCLHSYKKTQNPTVCHNKTANFAVSRDNCMKMADARIFRTMVAWGTAPRHFSMFLSLF